ncbi:putative DNA glycosylase At3g47830 [Phragmites australis]|uniref:putative DNA glycosylase At3g47830 n=1 Tax=Phragmites australis TaxID=29695 RepID=UPI002D799828|nr:putative DNA glycosylase At3g47830 [Phragmites australis]XP_062233200.1 putative DNA glycosylase At3g47830 [Phragmites australis]XP_062233201.1 putative DNA glycosylase At3g47830 [Phragmites australis]XP_062233202.1 putative DNA glycosylase At3g47830 [Phragmites australis]
MPRKPKRKHPSSPARRDPSPGPYPSHASPSPAQCLAVRDALLAFHGFPEEFAPFRLLRLGRSPEDDNCDPPPPTLTPTVLDGLVTTLLSQNTTDAISRRAFASLKAAFPSWDQVVDEEGKRLEDAIRCGGLAATKAARIRAMLRGVRERRGKICLEYLRELSVDEVKRELSQFKGIGPKTVACVLMFYLQKDDFPVDTHVIRITKAMGWVPSTASREKAYIHLNNKIPDDLKFDLNCLFVTHGKLCQSCTKKVGAEKSEGPKSVCPLASYCCVGEKLQQ